MILNSTLFAGEQSFGTTAGAPLSTSNASNQLVSGIINAEVSATASVTASGTATVITGMTTTPVAGTYLVVFSTVCTSASSASTTTFYLGVGGTQKADSTRTVSPFAGGTLSATSASCGVTINGIVTVNGSQAIAIYWSSTNTTLVTVTDRTLNILRIA